MRAAIKWQRGGARVEHSSALHVSGVRRKAGEAQLGTSNVAPLANKPTERAFPQNTTCCAGVMPESFQPRTP